jgi:hypothetical protein
MVKECSTLGNMTFNSKPSREKRFGRHRGEDVRVDMKLCAGNINRIELTLDGVKWWNIVNTEINYSIP